MGLSARLVDGPRGACFFDELRIARLSTVVGVGGNLLAVLLLQRMPSAYRLARLDEWVLAVHAQPLAAAASSVSFTLGLLGVAGWAATMGRRLGGPRAAAGASLVVVGAILNALGTLAPLVQALQVGECQACAPGGRALLGLTLTLDGLFNLLLGLGLLLMVPAVARRSAWDGRLFLLAGLVTLPVAAQAVWDPAASLLIVAGPLWLTAIVRGYHLLSTVLGAMVSAADAARRKHLR